MANNNQRFEMNAKKPNKQNDRKTDSVIKKADNQRNQHNREEQNNDPVMKQKRPRAKKGTLKRLIKYMFSFYPILMPTLIVGIVFSAVISSIPTIFMQKVIAVIEKMYVAKDWSAAKEEIVPKIVILATFYIISILFETVYVQIMAYITQGVLYKLRKTAFDGMQNLPLKYFDTNKHGDIMSYFTNDIDTIRQLISQALPNLLRSAIVVTTLFCIMIYYSVWLTMVVVLGVIIMFFVTKVVGGNSSGYFIRQQKSIGRMEGFIQEMMNGQKVVKVFSHEEDTKLEFDRINEELFEDASKANKFANILMPILNNIGNVLYVVVAMAGGILLTFKTPNLSLSGLPIAISIVVPFLNMEKQFSGNVSQVSQQINAVIMGSAGAGRVFELIDQQPEADEGYVTLVYANKNEDGTITESDKRTGTWAWKHPHGDGTITYTPLAGDVQMNQVDFGYQEDKQVLYDVSVTAKPGEKVAFVGATGAGKTTITNLINRFYDIADGKIRYDGININKIKKADLRRSLGVVLQDTNLFTGTVMDNIMYGNLDASKDECIRAAKLAGADDFITRLPDGYDTVLTNNGTNLSQGQRQLIAIARAAVADPPVMILDEATSSIDTRTEAIVQKGMDSLMEGRTVFVIAHRLSTVKNSDVIMVLDHGHIIEKGNHEELIQKKGTYYKLYTGAFELD